MRDWELHLGDALNVLPGMPDGSTDAVVCDPPAGIGMMGAEWDSFGVPPPRRGNYKAHNDSTMLAHGGALSVASSRKSRAAFLAFLTPIMAECLRVLKPGGYALVWALPRTSHWTATALEDAGFEIRDVIVHLFGCLSDDTEILTEKGWEPYHKIEKGSLALAYNVGDDSFRWEPIQEVLTYDYRDTAYRIQSDRTDQLVSRNHRCLVERGGGYAFEYAEALELEARVPVVEDVRGLLETLPLPQRHTGGTEQDVRPGVHRAVAFDSEGRGSAGQEGRAGDGDVREVRQGKGTSPEGDALPQTGLLQLQVPRADRGLRNGHGGPRLAREDRLDTGGAGSLPAEDERAEQPGVEGRGDCLQDSRPVRRGEVRSVPGGPDLDGPEGRLRDGAPLDRGAGAGADAVPDGGCPPRRPRPDEQRAEQSHALRLQPRPQAVRMARHATADLARVTPVFYQGVVWCVRVASGAFVARRNGKVFVTGNSGFPKGKGCLKPAAEHWILCRRPGPRVLPLNIEEARIPIVGPVDPHRQQYTTPGKGASRHCYALPGNGHAAEVPHPDSPRHDARGRWPANLCLSHHEACVCRGTKRVKAAGWRDEDGQRGRRNGTAYNCSRDGSLRESASAHHAGPDGAEEVEDWVCHPECPVFLLDSQAGELHTHAGKYRNDGAAGMYGPSRPSGTVTSEGNSGGASRFFYCSKADRADRGEGNDHATVKPTALMSWLVKLVTRPGETVLDPFAGSGSTGVAALRCERRFVGVERDAHYHAIALKRLAAVDGPLFALPAGEAAP